MIIQLPKPKKIAPEDIKRREESIVKLLTDIDYFEKQSRGSKIIIGAWLEKT